VLIPVESGFRFLLAVVLIFCQWEACHVRGHLQFGRFCHSGRSPDVLTQRIYFAVP